MWIPLPPDQHARPMRAGPTHRTTSRRPDAAEPGCTQAARNDSPVSTGTLREELTSAATAISSP